MSPSIKWGGAALTARPVAPEAMTPDAGAKLQPALHITRPARRGPDRAALRCLPPTGGTMPDVQRIPADLTLVLRRALIDEFATAADDAKDAADQYLPGHGKPANPELAIPLVKARARLFELEGAFEMLGGEDLITADDLAIPSDRRGRQVLLDIVEHAMKLERDMGGDGVPDADVIIEAGQKLAALRDLGDQLATGAATA